MNETPLHINAAPGNPNTFWQGASGRYYRTKKAAQQDNAEEAVNPEDYALAKTFFAKHKKKIIVAAVAVAVVVVLVVLYKKRIIRINLK